MRSAYNCRVKWFVFSSHAVMLSVVHLGPIERDHLLGEISAYYVPKDQDAWSGRGDELADLLWDRGIFLNTPKIMERLRKSRDAGASLPHCDLDIDQKFGGMGVFDEAQEHPVPNHLYEVYCPECGQDVRDASYGAWSTESELALKDRNVDCPFCDSVSATSDLQFGDSMCFARFYVWVTDCDQDQWDPKFRKTLEQIVGPCQEYWEWST